MSIWAVCLYVVGGEMDGSSFIHFVDAPDQDKAEKYALHGNSVKDAESFDVVAIAKLPIQLVEA